MPLYSESFWEKTEKEAQVVIDGDGKKGGEEDESGLKREVRWALKKHTVGFERAESVLREIGEWRGRRGKDKSGDDGKIGQYDEIVERLGSLAGMEKKEVDLKDKLYLAPLTTVGNLPFRRLCKEFGADITCGEMALAKNLLQGQTSEWALLRRHESEDVFGVQIADAVVDRLAKVSEVISENLTVDFIDLNAGCPIDLIFKQGSGCALSRRKRRFGNIVAAMAATASVPISVKLRIGIDVKKPNAHTLIPYLAERGASWFTLHGRSRKQRYSKLANWNYVRNVCAKAAGSCGKPLVGNGDIYDWRSAVEHLSGGQMETEGLSTIMIARGALMKPWLFTEIKEQRDWDITSSERLEMYRKFARYGLEHWGSDTKGVEKTRKFLLEWLGFACRYVPVGLIEGSGGIAMNLRAPYLRGRNELETLLSSQDWRDWVKITEMLLGKAPEGYKFKPKHKSNAWG